MKRKFKKPYLRAINQYMSSLMMSTISDTKSAADFNSGYAFLRIHQYKCALQMQRTTLTLPLYIRSLKARARSLTLKVQVGASDHFWSPLSTGSTFVVNCVNILSKEEARSQSTQLQAEYFASKLRMPSLRT
ncbi:Hypothetical_protein [Hexamita inflata]|uniref:Hypothetical_protein n=1 Tax=Hexamita inflata TaxID=28002 RepID=A0AA86N8I5_9EUKA|nr:Hypothetical protein HINF_LOCUS2410 [Hexamita inflata]